MNILRKKSEFLRNPSTRAGIIILSIIIGISILWHASLKILPLVGEPGLEFALKHHPLTLSDNQFHPPSAQYWFGTDVHGRDLFSRVVYGATISMLIGITGALVSLIIGMLWGTVAGYAGGRIDSIMMRIVDILYAMPSVIIVMVLITVCGPLLERQLLQLGVENRMVSRFILLTLGLGSVSWLTMARIVRAQVLSLKTQPFIDAARVLGASPAHILFKHIIPNVFGVAVVYWTMTIPGIVLYESFLSYLGLGVQPPMASLGSLIAEGVAQINPVRVYWWLIVCPGAVLLAILIALNLLGEGLREAWTTKTSI